MTKKRDADMKWNVFNNDIYLQFTYSLPKWRFTLGNRVMLYNYQLTDSGAVQKYFDVRNNTSASIIFVPTNRHQIQLGYYRKYYNPAYLTFFADPNTIQNEEWARVKGLLDEQDINQIKVAYAYIRQRITVQPEASFYIVEGDENFGEINASVYWKTKWLTLAGGGNVYIAKDRVFASIRCAPTAYLPKQWQIGLQVVYYTPTAPMRGLYGTPVYGCLSVNKQIGKFLNLGVDWHDMFDAFCSDAKVNRHAATVKIQFRF